MYQIAILGAGCFWGVEAAFQNVPGIIQTQVGYSGGHRANPTYEQVCSGATNHAEVVQIKFDSQKISYSEILAIFFKIHDPTTLNRQGPDIGTQYRSSIFYTNEEQKKTAQEMKESLDKSGQFRQSLVTQIEAASTFWPAEDYHQKYFEKRGIKPSCHIL